MSFADNLGVGSQEGAILTFVASLTQQRFSYSHVIKTLAGLFFFFHLRRCLSCT